MRVYSWTGFRNLTSGGNVGIETHFKRSSVSGFRPNLFKKVDFFLFFWKRHLSQFFLICLLSDMFWCHAIWSYLIVRHEFVSNFLLFPTNFSPLQRCLLQVTDEEAAAISKVRHSASRRVVKRWANIIRREPLKFCQIHVKNTMQLYWTFHPVTKVLKRQKCTYNFAEEFAKKLTFSGICISEWKAWVGFYSKSSIDCEC